MQSCVWQKDMLLVAGPMSVEVALAESAWLPSSFLPAEGVGRVSPASTCHCHRWIFEHLVVVTAEVWLLVRVVLVVLVEEVSFAECQHRWSGWRLGSQSFFVC